MTQHRPHKPPNFHLRATPNDVGNELAKKYLGEKITIKLLDEMIFDFCFIMFEMILLDERKFVFPGMGFLQKFITPPKKGRNKYTGEVIEIPLKQTVRFKISRSLHKKMNENRVDNCTKKKG
jgi:nucleoid DNA-binding protein